ncbi:MAG: DNA polymerase III subunit beta [Oligoflexia bacterium]|nr:DNA polymerase III subunit beta [Oligoflexia bacterium]
MHIVINSSHLRDNFSKLLSIVDKKVPRPILSYCMITAYLEDNTIEMIGSDSDVNAKIKIKAEVYRTGSFCIHGRNFSEILREIPSNVPINMEITEQNNLLKISHNDLRYSLLIFSTEDYPTLRFDSSGDHFVTKTQILQKIINKISYAVSQDDTMSFLSGIFIQKIGNKLRFVATDGHRLVLIDHTDPEIKGELLEEGIIIPKKGLNEIKKLSDSSLGDSLEIFVDNSFIYLKVQDSYHLTIRLMAKQYPRYQNVIPSKTIQRIVINRQQFLTAAKRLRVLANEENDGINFQFENDSMTFLAQNHSLGAATEKIPVLYKENPIEVCFNIRYLIEAVSVIDDEDFFLEFNNELGPFVIKMQSMPYFLSIIMPIKR